MGTGSRARTQSRWRAAQNETIAADQNPAPIHAAVIGGSMLREKNASVCSLSTNSCVPAKNVSAVST